MKKFLHSRNGASKGAALIIVLGFIYACYCLVANAPSVRFTASSMVINNGGHNYVVGDRLRAVGGTYMYRSFPIEPAGRVS